MNSLKSSVKKSTGAPTTDPVKVKTKSGKTLAVYPPVNAPQAPASQPEPVKQQTLPKIPVIESKPEDVKDVEYVKPDIKVTPPTPPPTPSQPANDPPQQDVPTVHPTQDNTGITGLPKKLPRVIDVIRAIAAEKGVSQNAVPLDNDIGVRVLAHVCEIAQFTGLLTLKDAFDSHEMIVVLQNNSKSPQEREHALKALSQIAEVVQLKAQAFTLEDAVLVVKVLQFMAALR